MLRAALKILLALALIAQGGMSAFAQDGAGPAAKMRCHHVDEHGKPVKMPCCPDGCVQDGVSTCSACVLAFIVPVISAPSILDRVADHEDLPRVMPAPRSRIPLLRPPIA